MVEAWFGILCLTLIAYAVMDGWNIGAGVIQLLVTRSPAERRLVVSAIGPLWTWHEVWLIAAGGVLFVAFPAIMSSALAGFYLAVFVLLWCVLGRGLSLEFGGHPDDPLWRTFWDVAFSVVNVLIALLLGAALGNLIRGVPLNAQGKFSLAFFTDFQAMGGVGILDWYTVSVAAFTLICTAAHGASYLVMRTEGEVRERSAGLARGLWWTVFALMPIITFDTWIVRVDMFHGIVQRPLAWLAVATAVSGAAAIVVGQKRGQDTVSFIGGCAFIAGLLAAAAIGVFPVMLYSTFDPKTSLTAFDGAVDGPGLSLALVWWPIAFVLTAIYGTVVFRQFRGKVRLSEERSEHAKVH